MGTTQEKPRRGVVTSPPGHLQPGLGACHGLQSFF